MKTIKLYGELGRRFGRVHHFYVNTPAEAVRALCVNYPGFQKYLLAAENDGIGFVVGTDKTTVREDDELKHPVSKEIRIIPKLFGSAGLDANTRIIIGSVLIVAGVIGSVFFGAGSPLIYAGAAMVIGGIVELMSPKPKAPEPPERADNKPSYSFRGPVNTTAQGHPVSLCYGKMIVGSAIVSGGIIAG